MVAEPDPDRLVAFPCPKCQNRTIVLQTRTRGSRSREGYITRRRVCIDKTCAHRFSTHELMCFAT